MSKLSQFLSSLFIPGPAHAADLILQRASINSTTGAATANSAGTDVVLTSTYATSGAITPSGQLLATKVWGAVWNDYADFQELAGPLEYGRCYYESVEGARICERRCQMAVVGIASDTFGHAVGMGLHPGREVPIAVAGWVLAHVDREYDPGTPLTNDEQGRLTEMTLEEKRDYPERLVATYKRKERGETFGVGRQRVAVNGRHWVRVR